MAKSEKNKIGLTLGILFACVHLVWAILVAAGVAQLAMDWILSLHMMTVSMTVTAFSLGNTIGLLIISFVFGYVIGWLFMYINELVGKKLK